ncbi:hypothetical protein LNP25_21000 [Klebsiella variicola subsp. variicola]|nr:hypothetical protein [Klebsiella variicola subsp. variicola]
MNRGRGGAPSREVLERIACGLRLTTPEREHLFILAFGHPPQTRLTVTDDSDAAAAAGCLTLLLFRRLSAPPAGTSSPGRPAAARC